MDNKSKDSDIGKAIQETLSLLQNEMNKADSFCNEAEQRGDKVDESFFEGRFKGLNFAYCNLYNRYYEIVVPGRKKLTPR